MWSSSYYSPNCSNADLNHRPCDHGCLSSRKHHQAADYFFHNPLHAVELDIWGLSNFAGNFVIIPQLDWFFLLNLHLCLVSTLSICTQITIDSHCGLCQWLGNVSPGGRFCHLLNMTDNPFRCCIWDVYTHDNVFATVAAQLFISAALAVVLPLTMVSIVKICHIPIIASPTSGYWTYITPLFLILRFFITLYLMYLVVEMWHQGPPSYSWQQTACMLRLWIHMFRQWQYLYTHVGGDRIL